LINLYYNVHFVLLVDFFKGGTMAEGGGAGGVGGSAGASALEGVSSGNWSLDVNATDFDKAFLAALEQASPTRKPEGGSPISADPQGGMTMNINISYRMS
jgi:hypothetical protein